MIVVFLRYPRVEKAAWKREIIEGLMSRGHEVSLFFGEASYLRHARAALKEFGPDVLKRRNQVAASSEPKLFTYFRERQVQVKTVRDLNGPSCERLLRRRAPDLLLLLGSGIIRKNILDIPRLGTVHCHQGYLPDYRGVNTLEWSIFRGDDVHVTTHFVDPGIDTGRILHRRQIPLYPGDNMESVRARCKQVAVPLLLQTIDEIYSGTVAPTLQKPEDGKQYFAMHPFFLDVTNRRLAAGRPSNGR